MENQCKDRKLHDIFDQAFDTYHSFENRHDATNSNEFQIHIKNCIGLFEECTHLVNITRIFSSNETYNELPTDNLKYLLLPYFLGKLNQKICGGHRADIVKVTEVYFNDFIQRLSEYDFDVNANMNKNNSTSVDCSDPMPSLTQMVGQRNLKLEKYRQKKELEDQIRKLRDIIKIQHIDEETKRDFFIKMLKFCVLDSQEELLSIDQEKEILRFEKNSHETMKKSNKPSSVLLKPIIITKNLAQKAVFGSGYPSMPTMTVSEFYDERVKQGIFPVPEMASNQLCKGEFVSKGKDNEDNKELEEKLDDDDEYERARLKAKDEYKDEHRRGEGNRYNRS